MSIDDPASCQRNYQLQTNAPLRDNYPTNPRSFSEQADQPVVRTGHDMFDALYALALEEVRENSVDTIQDGAFNGGQPISCPPGGCFETGRLWKYVWTRDIAYAAALSLGALDPTRARNSLEFKTSERRAGGGRQIVQDTGTGGSYGISTDRVVWAIGAWELLKYLDGTERTAFVDLAYEAMSNTAEHDRIVVFDQTHGLYTGEQSFLDWREQSYPSWTKNDTVQIGMSKALSTNIGHYALLTATAALATEKGLSTEASKYQTWADSLATAIATNFYLTAHSQFSTFFTTFLDPSATQRFDLLGSALAVLHDIAAPSQAAAAVSSYPHLPKGPPVIWPQQQQIVIYHNRGIWPFVTAFWLQAAKKVDNPAAFDHAVRSLMRGAALNLSNMENFEAATGEAWLDDYPYSGPEVNSHRQLWSVAGYAAMVHAIFGLEANQTGIRFLPFITRGLRNGLFAGANSIALSNFTYRGKRISVLINLDDISHSQPGALAVTSVKLNGSEVGTDFIASASLAGDNLIEVTLDEGSGSAGAITELDDTAIADYRNLFGPHTPNITNIGIASDRIQIDFDAGGEAAADVTFNVYRDGQQVATGLAGSSTSWLDTGSADHTSKSYCYTVETVFSISGTVSQHARPACYWGSAYERIQTVAANATNFQSNGGTLVNNYGKFHYEGWGDAGHTLTISNFTPNYTGKHLIQVLAGNGAGPFNTGITCAVKLVEVFESANLVGSGYLFMPQLDTWDDWRDSSFLPVNLDAAKTYEIVIREDSYGINMSEFEHFALYEFSGGKTGRFNRVNIAELKVLALEAQ